MTGSGANVIFRSGEEEREGRDEVEGLLRTSCWLELLQSLFVRVSEELVGDEEREEEAPDDGQRLIIIGFGWFSCDGAEMDMPVVKRRRWRQMRVAVGCKERRNT